MQYAIYWQMTEYAAEVRWDESTFADRQSADDAATALNRSCYTGCFWARPIEHKTPDTATGFIRGKMLQLSPPPFDR